MARQVVEIHVCFLFEPRSRVPVLRCCNYFLTMTRGDGFQQKQLVHFTFKSNLSETF